MFKQNVKYLVLFVAAAVIIGGSVFALNTLKSDSNSNTANTEETEISNIVKVPNGPYAITMQSKDTDGTEITGEIMIENSERSHLIFQSDDEVIEYIIYDGQYYLSMGDGEWISYSSTAGQNQTAGYLENSQLDEQTIEKLKTAPKLGEEACGDETCTVYELEEEGVKTNIYISNASREVKKLTGSNAELGEYEFIFDYSAEFTITRPENATQLNIPTEQ